MTTRSSLAFVVLSLGICVAVSVIYLIFNYEGPLERLKIGDIGIRKGESLFDASVKMDTALQQGGDGWKIIIYSRIVDRRASTNVGGGGNAIVLALVARQFDCDYIILKQEKCILFVDKYFLNPTR